ncbi:MAG: hypothetical protein HRU19_00815 [Pseudobacteriovorax sp.]|nr:hypothetical protein [Gammaproteobacteria bacterium]NRA62988.1 hypothetical protein [Pseudobacteriovorax sp.]
MPIRILMTMFILLQTITSQSYSEGFKLESILSDGMHSAELWFVNEPPELQAITKKFQRSLANHKEWFKVYLKQHGHGKLPWHKNMGITSNEYKKLEQIKDQIHYKKVKDIKLKMMELSSSFAITAHRSWKILDRLQVRLSKDRQNVDLKVGKLTNLKASKGRLGKSGEDEWTGTCWYRKEKDADNGASYATFCLGKINESNKGVLTYEARNRMKTDHLSNSDFVVTWPLQQ